jgi:hypothetical protein
MLTIQSMKVRMSEGIAVRVGELREAEEQLMIGDEAEEVEEYAGVERGESIIVSSIRAHEVDVVMTVTR